MVFLQSQNSSQSLLTAQHSPQASSANSTTTQFYSPDKPPIPPRGVPPPVPQRQPSQDNTNISLRHRNHSGSGTHRIESNPLVNIFVLIASLCDTVTDSGDANSNYGNYASVAGGNGRPVSMHASGGSVMDTNRNDVTSSQGEDMWRNAREVRIGKFHLEDTHGSTIVSLVLLECLNRQ